MRAVKLLSFVGLLLVPFFASCEGRSYSARELSSFFGSENPQKSCAYRHSARGEIIVVRVVPGKGVIVGSVDNRDFKLLFIETNESYADGDRLSVGIYEHCGMMSYEDALGVFRTVRSFREIRGQEALVCEANIKALILKEQELKRQREELEKEKERQKKAEEQERRKLYFENGIGSKELSVSNVLIVTPSVRKFIKKVTVDEGVWPVILQAKKDNNWLPVLKLCSANGWKNSMTYEEYPEESELDKCIKCFKQTECRVSLFWGDKIPSCEIVEYDLNTGKMDKCHVVDLKRNGIKIGRSINMQLGHRYFLCPFGGFKKLQSRYYSKLKNMESNTLNSGLQGAECELKYQEYYGEFFVWAKENVLNGELFKN